MDHCLETPTIVDFAAEIVTGTSESNAFINVIPVLDNPLPPAANYIALTMTFYDDYGNTPDKHYTAFYNGFLDAGANQHAETLPSVTDQQIFQTIGLATGTKVRVIEDPADLTKGQWLATVNF